MSNTNGTISEKGKCFSNLKNQFCIFDNNNRNAAAATEASLFRWPLLIHKNVCYQNKKERYISDSGNHIGQFQCTFAVTFDRGIIEDQMKNLICECFIFLLNLHKFCMCV